jgi:ATP sulfurylase
MQHLGKLKLDHLKNCKICRARISLVCCGHSANKAIRISNKNTNGNIAEGKSPSAITLINKLSRNL